jgi:hypothetical protein
MLHLFVDGNYFTTIDNAFNIGYEDIVAKTFYYDAYRFRYNIGSSATVKESFSICYDNHAFNAYGSSAGLDALYSDGGCRNLDAVTEDLVYTDNFAEASGEAGEYYRIRDGKVCSFPWVLR